MKWRKRRFKPGEIIEWKRFAWLPVEASDECTYWLQFLIWRYQVRHTTNDPLLEKIRFSYHPARLEEYDREVFFKLLDKLPLNSKRPEEP